jgi:hypothetical protein
MSRIPCPGLAFLEARAHGDPTAADELLPLIYRELQNLAAFQNSVGPCHYFASQFNSIEFFALLVSIFRIKG